MASRLRFSRLRSSVWALFLISCTSGLASAGIPVTLNTGVDSGLVEEGLPNTGRGAGAVTGAAGAGAGCSTGFSFVSGMEPDPVFSAGRVNERFPITAQEPGGKSAGPGGRRRPSRKVPLELFVSSMVRVDPETVRRQC